MIGLFVLIILCIINEVYIIKDLIKFNKIYKYTTFEHWFLVFSNMFITTILILILFKGVLL